MLIKIGLTLVTLTALISCQTTTSKHSDDTYQTWNEEKSQPKPVPKKMTPEEKAAHLEEIEQKRKDREERGERYQIAYNFIDTVPDIFLEENLHLANICFATSNYDTLHQEYWPRLSKVHKFKKKYTKVMILSGCVYEKIYGFNQANFQIMYNYYINKVIKTSDNYIFKSDISQTYFEVDSIVRFWSEFDKDSFLEFYFDSK